MEVNVVNYLLKKFPYYEEIVPRHLRKKWESKLMHSIWTELKGYFVVPWACRKKNVVIRMRTDRVKRINPVGEYTMPREYLNDKWRMYNTHDNAADEGYWNLMFYPDVPPEVYYKDDMLRYKCRVLWLWRNMAYTYFYEELGVKKEEKPIKEFHVGYEDSGSLWVKIEVYENYFKYECQIPDGDGGYKSYNFGWKAHRSAPALDDKGTVNVMYANRIVQLKSRKY